MKAIQQDKEWSSLLRQSILSWSYAALDPGSLPLWNVPQDIILPYPVIKCIDQSIAM